IQSNSLMITRIGTDVQISLGVSFSSVLDTVGVQFEIVPNLIPMSHRMASSPFAHGPVRN
ncbi:MAG: hypothetical protein L0215_17265, partial [Gemmataceae bacterium]|nr:hypothetical protein [Gemmataceae bacterium]